MYATMNPTDLRPTEPKLGKVITEKDHASLQVDVERHRQCEGSTSISHSATVL